MVFKQLLMSFMDWLVITRVNRLDQMIVCGATLIILDKGVLTGLIFYALGTLVSILLEELIR